MVKVTREMKDGTPSIRLQGKIDETFDFQKEFGALPKKVNVSCKEIEQINSLGVRAWIRFFESLTSSGTAVSFSECPPSIIEQLNCISNFLCGGQILSISLPFCCEECGTELHGTAKPEDIKKVKFQIPPVPCPKCSSKAIFDDIPEEYFAFMTRMKL